MPSRFPEGKIERHVDHPQEASLAAWPSAMKESQRAATSMIDEGRSRGSAAFDPIQGNIRESKRVTGLMSGKERNPSAM